MKKLFSTVLFTAFIFSVLVSQNNSLVVYSHDGLKFSLILNGIRQNNEPQTNVKVTGLNATNYQVKVIFANKMPDLNQNAYLMNGGEPSQNTEYTYSIVNVKGKYKLKFKSAAPISELVNTSIPEQTVVIYTPIERTTNTTTTTTNSTGTSSNANIGMNVNGTGMSMNININDINGGMGAGNSSSTTTTYSSSTTTTSSNTGMNQSNNTTYVLQGYNGAYGCPYPMGASDFESAKASIKSKSFDDSKLTLAKQIIGSNCMLCSQIKELMLLITFEASRLDLAKFAWSHNLDKGNYYKLNDAFTFESSIDELNAYTQSH
ncbi:MAG: DUF4476 domain-containing protein [Bacteroidetes bacterium]|nr:DUF4476 domain-containing protein [Bacteroidota bacterium]